MDNNTAGTLGTVHPFNVWDETTTGVLVKRTVVSDNSELYVGLVICLIGFLINIVMSSVLCCCR